MNNTTRLVIEIVLYTALAVPLFLHLLLLSKKIIYRFLLFFQLIPGLINSCTPSSIPALTLSSDLLHPVMASTSFVLDLVNMVEIRAHGLGILLLLFVDDFGLAAVSSICFSIRFKLLAFSIWIELLNPVTLEISHTITEVSIHSKDGSTLWNLCSGKYCIYGVADSQMPLSTEVFTSPRSFTCTFSTPPIVPIKVEPRLDHVINLSNSSSDDRCVLREVDPTPQAPSTSSVPLPSDL